MLSTDLTHLTLVAQASTSHHLCTDLQVCLMPVLAAALDTWGARRETSTLPSRPHTNVGCAVVTRMTWRESIGLCDLQVQTKQVSEIYHWKYSPTKKTSTAKKAPPKKYHTRNSDSKSFVDSLFLGLPIPSAFHVEKNSQPQEVQVSPLKQFVAGRRLAHHLVHVPFDKAVPFRRQEWNCQWMDHEDTSKHFLENESATGKHHTLLSV